MGLQVRLWRPLLWMDDPTALLCPHGYRQQLNFINSLRPVPGAHVFSQKTTVRFGHVLMLPLKLPTTNDNINTVVVIGTSAGFASGSSGQILVAFPLSPSTWAARTCASRSFSILGSEHFPRSSNIQRDMLRVETCPARKPRGTAQSGSTAHASSRHHTITRTRLVAPEHTGALSEACAQVILISMMTLHWPMRSHCAIHRVHRAPLSFSLRTSRPGFCERLRKVLVSVRLKWVGRPDQETHK
jgi:hypothetical protein